MLCKVFYSSLCNKYTAINSTAFKIDEVSDYNNDSELIIVLYPNVVMNLWYERFFATLKMTAFYVYEGGCWWRRSCHQLTPSS